MNLILNDDRFSVFRHPYIKNFRNTNSKYDFITYTTYNLYTQYDFISYID